MRFDTVKGVGLVLLTAVVSVWLSLTGQLGLYIHPRYIMFTTILCCIALTVIIFGSKYRVGDSDDGHGHGSQPDKKPDIKLDTKLWRSISTGLAISICLFGAISLLLIKPVALTSATATQRGINAAASVSQATNSSATRQLNSSPLFAGSDYSGFTIKDWAGLMAQTDDVSYFTGKELVVTGFVVADQIDPKNVFYVSRFVVTCCAVDARPIGLAVYAPGWQSRFKNDDWILVRGAFAANPSAINQDAVAVIPAKLELTKQPERVYDY